METSNPATIEQITLRGPSIDAGKMLDKNNSNGGARVEIIFNKEEMFLLEQEIECLDDYMPRDGITTKQRIVARYATSQISLTNRWY